MALFVVHYSEVALKGKNRPEFLRALRHNMAKALVGLQPKISLKDGRFLVEVEGGGSEAEERLSRVFGVAWFAPVSVVPRSYPSIQEEVLRQARLAPQSTFRISPRRSDKTFPINSSELATRLGSDVARGTEMKVNLSHPGLDLHVDVIRNEALVYSAKSSGPGGLPVGTAGRVMHLFSGGIDSPVAAWLLMKRGCRPVYVHFYLAPTPESATESKITKLVKVLSLYGGRCTLVLIPFAEYQLATTHASEWLEPSLFRRFMRMTAEALAPKFRAGAIATGDSLSQAASQTLWNLASFDSGASLPILRPLLTFDKDEIIDMARSIGTYDLSLEEYKDCCAIITRHPLTRTKANVISEYAKDLSFDELASRSIKRGTLVSWDPATSQTKVTRLVDSLGEHERGGATRGGEADPETPRGRAEAKI
ncbi:MAG TPA: tRNA uracil 4-sulfurtransferase ThiI [Nitrososphaerales archaeon]|nr:tRNA uracil 4-sulfurtransferase ThiI [Nitrososphaerales archaeon]